MTRMPIVVAFPFIGDELGGSHISAINLIAAVDRSKIKPIVVLHRDGGILSKYLASRGIPYIVAPACPILSPAHRAPRGSPIFTGIDYIVRLPSMRKFLRERNIDVVHTNDGRMHATWALPTRLAGARLLWHHRGDPKAQGANMLAPLLANQIVTVSNFAKPSWPILPIGRRVTVIHSPFDHPASVPDREESRLALVRELRLPNDVRFAGYFGSLIERKRPLLFVEIIAAYRRRHPDVPLHGLLFGVPEPDGLRLDESVARLAGELGISSHIHLMGFRSPIAPFMCGVDAMLVPAINEPFGRTLIEAMLLGTPVIATDHGGNPEAICDGENGLLVKPEDAKAFVAPLHRLLTNRGEWQRISETARARALVKYGTDAHVAGITNIYQKIVGNQ
jgi:glycosyltransferase involved in cell wall biosynthesis